MITALETDNGQSYRYWEMSFLMVLYLVQEGNDNGNKLQVGMAAAGLEILGKFDDS